MQSDLFAKRRPDPVPTLAVKQPYAEFVMAGTKTKIFTSEAVRPGILAIYAPRFYVQSVEDLVRHKPHFKELIGRPLSDLESGSLLGLVQVTRAQQVPLRIAGSEVMQSLTDEELDLTDRIAPRMWCLTVTNPRRLSSPVYQVISHEFTKSDPAIFGELL